MAGPAAQACSGLARLHPGVSQIVFNHQQGVVELPLHIADVADGDDLRKPGLKASQHMIHLLPVLQILAAENLVHDQEGVASTLRPERIRYSLMATRTETAIISISPPE